MRTVLVIAAAIAVIFTPMTGQCDVTPALKEGAMNAHARYRTHRYKSHHHRRHVVDHHRIRDGNPSSSSRSSRGLAFGVRHDPIVFLYTTGTTILDSFEGRRPAIEPNSCADSIRILDYNIMVDALARY